jgi:hypothetical protein
MNRFHNGESIMEICVSQDFAVSLRDVDNFKVFKVVAAVKRSAYEKVRAHFGDAGYFRDPNTAFISEHWLHQQDETRDDAAWQHGLGKMISYAQSMGWVDAVTGAIQAHIEWCD